MKDKFKIIIDGKELDAKHGQTILEVATDNGIYIPTLCNYDGLKPQASCRICSVKVNGRFMTACTTIVSPKMEIENNTKELNNYRKIIVETMFVTGNHFCPSCEKSGNCELQALAYRLKMDVPRFPYSFSNREIEASNPKLIIDHNRCIKCKRCARGIKTEDGKNLFAFKNRGDQILISIDKELAKHITDEKAQEAMDICPVGAIIRKEVGFIEPIGSRKYDNKPIGNTIEKEYK
ncbi:MAG: 2Fe-2S iron-sulfur cluster-binding protein [Candidatus Marinimicrobia bacterium]|nr:2Fe-2S iron-sulfur cluster-binding protein [Candidatus Neomarinimicrobiota bacterium]